MRPPCCPRGSLPAGRCTARPIGPRGCCAAATARPGEGRAPTATRRLRGRLSEALCWLGCGLLGLCADGLWRIADPVARRVRTRRRPLRIVLVRNGESLGNVCDTTYETIPDSSVPLTTRGFEQGVAAGWAIQDLIGDETVRFFHSPYMRTRQTTMAILEAFRGRSVELTTEPMLREQDFGNFQDPETRQQSLEDRRRYGRFYYRFQNGEAGTDVYDRVAEFWSTLHRVMSRPDCAQNLVVVTHGLLMRIFCMCYFRWTVLEFERVWNPSNCEVWILERTSAGRYRLAGRLGSGGALLPIRFGADQSESEPLWEHMREPLASRSVAPGTGQELEDERLRHLRAARDASPGVLHTVIEEGARASRAAGRAPPGPAPEPGGGAASARAGGSG
ncbi:unnamed protein product [Prorocentrum cordatum]|uniref:Histidine phosphatase family protein n=1 Tax=Prorocentrum cordatum TaxID=2364126 RepID=A0ABN9UNE7_9DINO|nr:unnamed protein product [Polarella glacialis]